MADSARYSFGNIFTYDSVNGILIPKYNVVFNNWAFTKGMAINRTTGPFAPTLFNYIGRDMIGKWNPTTAQLTVEGFI
jgi:hypothetical protein